MKTNSEKQTASGAQFERIESGIGMLPLKNRPTTRKLRIILFWHVIKLLN
jgi:hypothetical protein